MVLAEMLAEDLDEWPGDGWVVIDDYQHLAASVASERFVETIVERSPVRILVASRVRPSWIAARSILDGDVLEIPENELAMSAEEVEEVLDGARTELASGLVALAGGWPAVVGLAGMAPDVQDVDAVLPETLYEFFAERDLPGPRSGCPNGARAARDDAVRRPRARRDADGRRARRARRRDGARTRTSRRAGRPPRAPRARRGVPDQASSRGDSGRGRGGLPDRVGVLHGPEGAGRGVRPGAPARRPERHRPPAHRHDGRAPEQRPSSDARDVGESGRTPCGRDARRPRRPGRDRAPPRAAPDGAGAR